MAEEESIKDFYRRCPEEKYGILCKVSHQHNILDVLYGGNGIQNPSPAWTYEVSPGIPPVDQQHTGRCWIFSMLTVHNHLFRNQYAINNSKAAFSEGYIGFWDLFEKSRFFLHVVLDHRDEDLEENGSLADFIKTGVQDGGDYIFAMNIMEKYGVVPVEFYPNRTYGSMATESVLSVLNQLLRDNAVTLRETGDRRKIKPMLHNVFAILVLAFGLPPCPWNRLNWSIEQNEGYNYYAFEQSQQPEKLIGGGNNSSSIDNLITEIDKNDGILQGEEGDDLSNADSTIRLEEEIEARGKRDDAISERSKDKKTIEVERPLDDGKGGRCGRTFERFFANLIRPGNCNRTSKTICGGIRVCNQEGQLGHHDEEIKKMAYRKKKDSEKKLEFNYTPIQFYKKFISVVTFVPLLCDPRYPRSTFLVMNDTNMIGGREGKYLNVTMDEMVQYAIESLKLNIPVFFAADV